ncbi:MAG TPA: alanine racemase [Candidatus Saccharimonadales bacterium]|nr:alanine racemase [Candidatus Saccharimonadales bacterium]
MTGILRTTIVDVDLDAVAANTRAVRTLATVDVIAVVKADGYGHGAEAVAEAAIDAGASALAVATVEEAVVLRRTRPRDALLVLLGAQEQAERDAAVALDLAVTVWDIESARAMGEAARAAGRTATLHFKVDTGLTRLGAPLDVAVDRYREIEQLAGVQVDGVFTHLARAEEQDPAPSNEQLDRFDAFLDAITPPRWVHASASGGVSSLPIRKRVTAVRPGLAIYGLDAAPHLAQRLVLRPALTWRSKVHRTADVPKGTGVSYGHEYRLPRDGRIATVPVGYGDGLARASRAARLLVHGQTVPIAGRVAMDHVMLDVTDLGDVRSGDEVVVIGTQRGATVTADDLARASGTINYEVVTAIKPRVPRRYLRDGRVVATKTLADGYAPC